MASTKECGACSHDDSDKRIPAIKWCIECQEAICKDCTESHRKIKYIRNHRLIDLDEKAEIIKFDLTKCKRHPNLEEEYFCSDHDVTCCADCRAKDHKACPRTVSVESASVGIRQSELLNECVTKTTTISETFDDIIQFCERNKQVLETDADKIRDEINRLEVEYIKQIKEMKHGVLEKLREIKQDKNHTYIMTSNKALGVKARINNHKKKA